MRRFVVIAVVVATAILGALVIADRATYPDGGLSIPARAQAKPSGGLRRWAPAQTAQDFGASSGTLAGTVFLAGRPVAGALVRLYPATQGAPAVACAGAGLCDVDAAPCDSGDALERVVDQVVATGSASGPPVETVSGPDGRFAFNVGGHGPYVLTAEHQARLAYTVVQPSHEAELVLRPPVTVTGRVLDAYGRAAIGAAVIGSPSEGGPAVLAHSGEDGRFALTGLPASDGTRLVVAHAGFTPELRLLSETSSVAVTLAPAPRLAGKVLRDGVAVSDAVVCATSATRDVVTRTLADGTFFVDAVSGPVKLVARSGDEVVARMVVIDGSTTSIPLELTPTASIAGFVRTARGEPAIGASVTLTVDGFRWPAMTTDAHGVFSVSGLPAGLLHVEVRALGPGRARAEHFLRPNEQTRLELELSPVFRIAGTVVDGRGAPVAAAQVRAREGGSCFPDLQEAISGPDGTFVVEVGMSGRYWISAAGADQRVGTFVEVPAQDVRLVFRDGHVLRGRVVDPSGAPAAGAAIHLIREEAGPYASGITDAAGRFELRNLPAGRFRASVRGSSHDGALQGSQTVQVPSPDPVTVRLDPPSEVIGRLMDEIGAPVAGVAVTVEAEAASRSSHVRMVECADVAISDEQGRFRLLSGCAGPFAVSVDPGDFEPAFIDGVKAGEEVTLRLDRREVIVGRAVRPNGEPVNQLRVDGEFWPTTAGRFEMPRPPRYANVLAFDSGDDTPLVRRIVGEESDLGDIVLPIGREVHGRVLDATTGMPVASALVVAHDDGERSRLGIDPLGPKAQRTTADGSFTLRGVSEFEWVTVQHPDFVRSSLRAGRSGSIEAWLERAGRVRGFVRTSDRGAATRVILFPPDGEVDARIVWVHGGKFDFPEVAPATYRVLVLGAGDRLLSSFEEARITVGPGDDVQLQLRERPSALQR